MKQATDKEIRAAVTLILGAGALTTTTLDVKNAVRGYGYYCLQADVSRALDRMYADGELVRTHSAVGGYYDYALPAAQSQGDTLSRVIAVVADALSLTDDEKDAVTADTTLVSIGGDSLSAVEIVMGLEKEFNVSIGDDALPQHDAASITVGSLVTLVGGQNPVAVAPANPQPMVQPAAKTFPLPMPDPDPASWKDVVPVGTWVVREADGTGQHVNPFAFDGTLGRDAARSAYAKLNGVPRDNTRARRVRA